MLADKEPFETIMRYTNLTLDQIEALANQNGNSGAA